MEAINIENGTFGVPHKLRLIYISLAHMAIFDFDSVSSSMPRQMQDLSLQKQPPVVLRMCHRVSSLQWNLQRYTF